MSAKKPVRLMRSGLTGRVYAVTAYTVREDGGIVARTKHDVTDDFHSVMVAFAKDSRPAAGGSPDREGET